MTSRERVLNAVRHQQSDRTPFNLRPGPEIKVAFHCCGYVMPLIPNLIELGVDILEALQAESMDIHQAMKQHGIF